MNRRWVPLIVLPLLLLTAACGDDDPKTVGEATVAGKAVSIGMDANNSTQRVKVGGFLQVTLETAGGSGYSWEVTTKPDAKVLKLESQNQEKVTASTETTGAPMTGTPENVITTFKAVGKGTTKVVLGHVPPAGGDAEETFTVTVIVE